MANWLRRNHVTLVVAGIQALLALAILRFGREGPLPLHFGLNGEVDRYGDRAELALAVAGIALLSVVAGALLRPLMQRKGEAAGERNHAVAVMLVLTVTSLVCALFAAIGFGLLPAEQIGGKALMAVIAAALMAAGADLGKVSPNPLIGVRTPWTYASRLSWDKSNRLAGRLFLWTGVAGFVAAPLAPQPLGVQVLVGILLVITVVVVFESWRVWRTDTDRKGAF
jgi:uncharacterized membrane protein